MQHISPPRLPRVSTQPLSPTPLAVDRIRMSRSFTPTSPKTSPPISPKDDKSLGPFGTLPRELIIEIFTFLPVINQKILSETCHTFRKLTNDPILEFQVRRRVYHAVKILREKIPICIGFSSQSLKGVLEDRVKLNPQIVNLQGQEYLKALQNCEFTQQAIFDENGWLLTLNSRERFRNLRTYILANDPFVSKSILFFPSISCTNFKIISHWESGKFKSKEVEETENHSPRSPKSRSTWKLVRLEYQSDNLSPLQRKVIEKALAELNRRPIDTLIRMRGELIFGDQQDTF